MADKLSRTQMVKIIEDGGSVFLDDGRIINSVGALPNEAELAKGDSKLEASTRAALEAQKAAIDAQLAQLNAKAEVNETVKTSEVVGADDLPADLAGRQFLIDDKRFVTRAAVEAATDDDLLSVKHIGKATLDDIRSVIPRKE